MRLLTLNCWGLGMGISKDRDQRMQVCILTVFDLMVILMLQDIGQFIAQQDYDIVFLQV